MEGAILLHRALLESYAFKNEVTLKVWIWLLLKANWKQSHVSLIIGKANTTVAVNRGELIYGRNKASEELQIPGNTIERHIKKLQENLQIVRKTGTHYSIITICKYDTYQSINNTNGQATGRQRAGNGQATGTYNKDNKDNNVNNREARAKVFYEELKPFLNLYTKEILRDFYEYWIEPNKSKTKMRFELEPTWDTKRRLKTWANREKVVPKESVNTADIHKSEFEKAIEKQKELLKND